jgi:amino acid adenylation domain-containing protein
MDRVNVRLDYWTSKFSSSWVQRLAKSFEHIFHTIMSSPNSPVKDLTFITENDVAQIDHWNNTYPLTVDRCMHTSISAQALERPKSQAVCAWDGVLTYEELDQVSDVFAAYLTSLGIGEEMAVPLCFDKSLWTVVGKIAVLKAGAAFVLLDPAHPPNRRADICSQVDANIVLISNIENQQKQWPDSKLNFLEVSLATYEQLKRKYQTPYQPVDKPGNMAYIAFTSGTTGTPKGIVTEHRAYCSGVAGRSKAMMRTSETRILQFSSYGFDASIEDTISTLIVGGCVCIPSEEERMNDLAGAINRMQVNAVELTPSVAKLLDPEDVPSLKVLMLGGEQVTMDVVTKWEKSKIVINCYGPTECSVTSVVSRQVDSSTLQPSNIGLGLGALTWVVNAQNHHQLTPVGGIGELLLEGPILARGYRGRQDLTDKSFIVNPSWAQPRGSAPRRFYKTGDLVQCTLDGSLICLGRQDGQIKLYGQRIELDEIDSNLISQLPWNGNVASCLATTTSTTGKPIIAAFFSLDLKPWRVDDQLEFLRLSETLRRQILNVEAKILSILPVYMRPGLYIPVSRIPTSPSGKKNRALLSQAVRELSKSKFLEYALDMAEIQHELESLEQEQLRELWAQVLKIPIERIGIFSHFFRLGGDSILSIHLSATARKQGFVLNVADIFRYPVLRDMARLLLNPESSTSADLVPLMFSQNPAPLSLLGGVELTKNLLDEIHSDYGISTDLVEDIYPCSAMQEGLMAISIRQENSYIAQFVYEIPSATSTSQLKSAWVAVVSQIPLLRTRIVFSREHGSFQFVLKAHGKVIDDALWQKIEHQDLDTFLTTDRQVPMGYGSVLSRCNIVRNGRKTYLVWAIHHAIYDGWFVPTVLRKVAQAYYDEESIKESLTAPFSRFIAYLQETRSDDWEKYWTSQLQDFKKVDFPARMVGQISKGREFVKTLSIDIKSNRSKDVTIATILRATWTFLVSRYSESDDITFGATLTGRNVAVEGIADMVGPTLTTVPVRVRIDNQKTVAEFLQAIQQQATEMISFEHNGLQNIKKLGNSYHEACDFRNLLVIQPGGDSVSCEGVDVIGRPIEATDANGNFHIYPLVVSCTTSERQVELEVKFDAQALSEIQVDRLMHHFETVFQQFRRGDSLKVGDIEMISPQDKQEIISWNHQTPEYQDVLVHDVIREQTRIQPDAEAVYGWDMKFTYKELDAYSTSLAHILKKRYHIGPEKLVPLLFEKSAWIVVAMMAVMKAGGGFVPLDISHPLDRINDIISQSNAILVLVSPLTVKMPIISRPKLEISLQCFSKLDERRTASPESRVSDVLHSSPENSWTKRSLSSLDGTEADMTDATRDSSVASADSLDHTFTSDLVSNHVVRPGNVIYVIFTSGSTGKPKGVVIEHSQFCSGVLGPRKEALLRSTTSRVLQFASFSFDTSLEDILTTLVFGGCVCIPSEHDRLNNITAFINESSANTAHITPSFANTLSPRTVPGLQFLRLGGERMTSTHISTWANALELRNVYGPTETCITATCSETVTYSSDPTNIGKGVAALTWIVNPDNHDQLTPLGLVGELLVEGPLLARGYLDDPEKTNKSFITAPKWASSEKGHPPRRFYKTGDLVRYGDADNILYIGRKDTQVKIYGQRIEIGEVEDHLKKALLPRSIDLAVETAILPGENERKQLVAFLCMEDDIDEDDTELGTLTAPTKELLREITSHLNGKLFKTLPFYMIPSRYIPLKSMPRTLAGKVDRRRLQQMLRSLTLQQLLVYSMEDEQKPQPESEMEKRLQAIWANLLILDPENIGVHDSFLKLGGDSFTAIKLASALRDCGINLGVSDIFQNPQLSEMAKIAGHQVKEPVTGSKENEPFVLLEGISSSQNLLDELENMWDITKDKVVDAYPCSPLQAGLLSLSGKNSQSSYVSHTVYDLPANVDIARFKESFQSVYETNDILRTQIVYLESHGMVQVVTNCNIQWELGTSVNEILDRSSVFGLGTPLIQVSICPTNKILNIQRWAFVIVIHHSLYDGWSFPLLLQQVEDNYRYGSLPAGQPRFRDFIQYITGCDEDNSRSFWESQFLHSDETCDLPLQQTTVSYQQDMVENITRTIKLPYQKSGLDVTPASIIRAAWALVIAAYSGSNDVVFGATVTGRTVPVTGIDKIIGPTLATIPVRVQMNSEWTIRDLLLYVLRSMTETIPHEHFGIHNVKQLNDQISAHCDFNSLLVIQPRPGSQESTLFNKHRELPQQSENGGLTYPVAVECTLGEDEHVQVHIEYIGGAISRTHAVRIISLFEHIIYQLCSNPESPISQLSLVSPSDFTEICSWNHDIPAPINMTVTEMLETQMQHSFARPAIYSWDRQLLYEDLDRLARKLSHYLIAYGVTRGDLVPVVMEKSALYTISLLAVIYAGAAFVPLDATHVPSERMLNIFKQCKSKVVLASTTSASNVTESDQLQVLRVSHLLLDQLPGPNSNKDIIGSSISTPADILYAVFTSGSTGTPKGVITTHQAYASSFEHKRKAFDIDEQSRVLQFSSHSFDVSIDDILITLLSGGCVCVPSEKQRINDLAGFISEADANWVSTTPTVTRTFDPAIVSRHIKNVMLVGEKVTSDDIHQWVDWVDVKNAYGPAECCVISLSTETVIDTRNNPANIGRGTSCGTWVVDPEDSNRLAPIGAVGELVIHGPGIAEGYLGDPTKTKQVFIDTPSWLRGIPLPLGLKMYKTGDLVRYQDDGTLVYVGRKDTQIKIRGMRMELEEVEHAIYQTNLPGVQRIVVDVVTSSEQTPAITTDSLVVFIVPSTDNLSTPGDIENLYNIDHIKSQLVSQLPGYMIPNYLVILDEIPIFVSGKRNRKQMLEIAVEHIAKQQQLGLSSDTMNNFKRGSNKHVHEYLKYIWAGLLKVNRSSISDDANFFHLGGDSITVMRLVAAARSKSIKLTAADIYQLETLSRISAKVEYSNLKTSQSQEKSQLLQPRDVHAQMPYDMTLISSQLSIKKEDIETVIEATDFQAYCLAQLQTKSRGWLNYFSYTFRGEVDVHALRKSCYDLLKRHAILRTRFVVLQGTLLQVTPRFRSEDVHFDVHDYSSGTAEPSFQDLIKTQNTPSLDDPLVRFIIQMLGHNRVTLIMRISHAQYDGVCLPVIHRDLQALYKGEALPDPHSFSEYVFKNEDTLSKSKESEQYWSKLLVGSTITPFFIARKPHSLHSNYPQTQSATRATPLPRLTNTHNTITPATIVKAAWALVLGHISQNDDVVFGNLLSTRTSVDGLDGIDQLVGPCLNFVPVRLTLGQHSTGFDLLRAVQQQYVTSLPHAAMGFRRIFEHCTNWPSVERFSSVLQYQNLDESMEKIQIGSADCTVDAYVPATDAADVWILVTPEGGHDHDVCEIKLHYSPSKISPQMVEAILDEFQNAIQFLSASMTESADAPLKDILQLRSPLSVTIPLDHHHRRDSSGVINNHSRANDIQFIQKCWEQVFGALPAMDSDVSRSLLHTPFYNIWADPVGAAQLSSLYRKSGANISLEEIMEYPTIFQQSLIWSYKLNGV